MFLIIIDIKSYNSIVNNKEMKKETITRLAKEKDRRVSPLVRKEDMSTWYETNETNDYTNTNISSTKASQMHYNDKVKKHKHHKSSLHLSKKKIIINLLDKTIQSLTQLKRLLLNDCSQVKEYRNNKRVDTGNNIKRHMKDRINKYDVNKSIEIKPNVSKQYNKSSKKIGIKAKEQNKKSTTINDTSSNTILIRPFSQLHKLNKKKVEKQECFSFILTKHHKYHK